MRLVFRRTSQLHKIGRMSCLNDLIHYLLAPNWLFVDTFIVMYNSPLSLGTNPQSLHLSMHFSSQPVIARWWLVSLPESMHEHHDYRLNFFLPSIRNGLVNSAVHWAVLLMEGTHVFRMLMPCSTVAALEFASSFVIACMSQQLFHFSPSSCMHYAITCLRWVESPNLLDWWIVTDLAGFCFPLLGHWYDACILDCSGCQVQIWSSVNSQKDHPTTLYLFLRALSIGILGIPYWHHSLTIVIGLKEHKTCMILFGILSDDSLCEEGSGQCFPYVVPIVFL